MPDCCKDGAEDDEEAEAEAEAEDEEEAEAEGAKGLPPAGAVASSMAAVAEATLPPLPDTLGDAALMPTVLGWNVVDDDEGDNAEGELGCAPDCPCRCCCCCLWRD